VCLFISPPVDCSGGRPQLGRLSALPLASALTQASQRKGGPQPTWLPLTKRCQRPRLPLAAAKTALTATRQRRWGPLSAASKRPHVAAIRAAHTAGGARASAKHFMPAGREKVPMNVITTHEPLLVQSPTRNASFSSSGAGVGTPVCAGSFAAARARMSIGRALHKTPPYSQALAHLR
jgi:hypothetical protein